MTGKSLPSSAPWKGNFVNRENDQIGVWYPKVVNVLINNELPQSIWGEKWSEFIKYCEN